jgi:hypothetical protein
MIFGFRKRSKYGNKRVEYDGVTFDSKKERDRYIVLKDAERQGIISDLQRQVRYELHAPEHEEYEVQLKTKTIVKTRTIQRGIYYTCDFQYMKDGVLVVEDVKSSPRQTALDKAYQIRKKLFFSKTRIHIKEVFNAKELV